MQLYFTSIRILFALLQTFTSINKRTASLNYLRDCQKPLRLSLSEQNIVLE